MDTYTEAVTSLSNIEQRLKHDNPSASDDELWITVLALTRMFGKVPFWHPPQRRTPDDLEF